jgi:HlyD family secretion protein
MSGFLQKAFFENSSIITAFRINLGLIMNKKLIISIFVVFILVAVAYFVFLHGGTQEYVFRFDKVSKGDITMFVTATGTINAVTSVDVGTQVSGIVSKLYADFNSVVKEGQIIALIDTTFLVQSVKDADANLYRAKAQLADSKRALDREKVLVEKGLDPQINLDAALTTFESNDAALKQAEATLERAKINLAYATIFAPISGVVINRAVNVGQTVAASFSSPTLYTIANDLSKMQVLTTVDESDIGRVSIGQEATFTVDAYPDETFKGSISQIRLAPVSVQNVVNYTVVIDVNNDQLKLMPGMTANVKVQVASVHDALKVPNMALRFQPPTDLIDSTKIKARRDAMIAGNPTNIDTSRTIALTDAPDKAGGDRRKQFSAVRDSIIAAHGGKLSKDDLQSKMMAAFKKMRGSESIPSSRTSQSLERTPKTPKFGITQIYPEYQKSPYIPQHQSGRARIWITNANGKLDPIYVKTGVTDGKFTEITTTELKPGDQIVLGVLSNSNVATSQSPNPLTGGGGQQRTPGGGGFR